MATWRFVGHLSTDKNHVLAERCVEHPEIHRELVTRVRNHYPVGSAKTFYFVDQPYDPAEYATFDEALSALEGVKP